MWEFNTCLKSLAHCRVITQSEQMLGDRFQAYQRRRCLAKHPRFHLSQWNKGDAILESDSDVEE